MATTIGRLRFIIEADDRQYNATVKSAESKFSQLGKNLERIGTGLTVGLTAPLVLLSKKILDIGFDYEKSMNTFQAVTRASADEMSRAAAVAEKLGADMSLPATSAADAAKAMTELAKGGFTATQAMDAARGALQLAAAAGIDEARAAEITANALNTFHLSASESSRVSDLLAGASAAASGEITDMAAALQQSGSSAAALKIPIEDLTTAISLMAKNGILGSDAGTSLKTFMAALTPSTKEAAVAMKQLGIDAFDARGNFVGLEAIIAQAQPALARMTAEQRANAIESAFGSDAQRAANIVLGEGIDVWNKMAGAVSQSGAAAELAAAKTKGLSGAWDGFISQLETAGLKIFQQLAPSLENIVRKMADMVSGLASLNPEFIKMGIAVAGVAGASGPLALLAGKLLALGPQGAIVAAVIAGIAAIAAAYTTNFAEMTRTLDGFAASFLRAFGQNKTELGAWSDLMAQLGIVASATLDLLLTGFGQLANLMGGVIRANLALMKGDFTGSFNAIKEGFKGVADAGDDFNTRMDSRAKQLRIVTEQGAKGLMDYLRVVNSQGGIGAGEAYFGGYKSADPFGKIKTSAINEMQDFSGKLRSIGAGAGLAFGTGLREGAYSATHQSPFFMIHWLMEAADYANKEAPAEFGKAGSKMGEKLKVGFQAALGNINDFLGRAIGGTGTISENVFDIILRKFPEVAQELQGQARWLHEVNEAFSLYATVASTAAGKNTEFAEKVRQAVGNLLQFDRVSRELAPIIPIFTELNNTLSDTVTITKEMGEAIREGIGSLVSATISANSFETLIEKMQSSKKAAAEWGKVMSEAVAKVKDDIRRDLGDGVGGALIALAAKFGWHLDKVRGWVGDVVGIIDTLPGKFGDMARDIFSTIQQWVAFADRILSILHRLDDGIPGSIGGIVSKIAGMLKKNERVFDEWGVDITDIVKSATKSTEHIFDEWGVDITDIVGKSMNKVQGAAKTGMEGMMATVGKYAAGIAGILGGIGTFMGSRNQGKVTGILGGAMAGAQVGGGIGFMVGGPVGAGIGTAIGAGAGAILGLFGSGKSKEQRAAEEAAKQKAGLDMQKLAADIMTSQMEGLKKGLELLEGLKTFSEVPRKAITRFFNEIETIITLFAEMAKKFKADSIEASKTVAEVMSGAFESLLSGAALINAIKTAASLTDQNIADFISTTFKIFEKWSKATDEIEISTAKFTGKIADKLRTSFEFLSIVPDLLKGITENKSFDASLIDPLFASIEKIVQKMKTLSEAERGLELNRAGAAASVFGAIFESLKQVVESLTAFGSYKAIGDSVFGVITSDIQKMLVWLDETTTLVLSGITKSDTLKDALGRLAGSLGSVKASMESVTGAFSSSGSSGTTASIVHGDGAQFVQRQGAAAAAVTNQTQYNTITINLPAGTDAEQARRVEGIVRRIIREENRGDLLASSS